MFMVNVGNIYQSHGSYGPMGYAKKIKKLDGNEAPFLVDKPLVKTKGLLQYSS